MRMSPNIDTYGYLEREMVCFLIFFLPIPSEYVNIWLWVFDNGSCPLKHISYSCGALHLLVLWRQNSSWTFSTYFQMNPISSAPFLYQTFNSLAPCRSHFKDQCGPHTPLSYHSPLFLPISLAQAATGFLYPSCHAWGQHLILIRRWGQLQGVSLCPFPFPRLFAMGKWGKQRRFPISHRTEQSFQALCAPSYPLAFSRGWIKLLSGARNFVCFLNSCVWDH